MKLISVSILVFGILLFNAGKMQFLKEQISAIQNQTQELSFQNQNSERNLAQRTKQQKAYLAALVVSTAVVVVGISLWIFQDIFRNQSAGVYSNIEFEIVDPKIQVKKVGKGQKQQQQDQSAAPANKKKGKKGKKTKKGKKGKENQQNYNDEQYQATPNRQARYQQQDQYQEEDEQQEDDGRYQFTKKNKTRIPKQIQENSKPKKGRKDVQMDPKQIEINFEDNQDEDEKIRGQSLRKKPKVRKAPPQYRDEDSDSEQQYYVPKRQKQMNLDEDRDPVQAVVKKAKKKKKQQQQRQEGDQIYA